MAEVVLTKNLLQLHNTRIGSNSVNGLCLLDIEGALLKNLAVRAMLAVVASVSRHLGSECWRKKMVMGGSCGSSRKSEIG
jgi:hypothetical protein